MLLIELYAILANIVAQWHTVGHSTFHCHLVVQLGDDGFWHTVESHVVYQRTAWSVSPQIIHVVYVGVIHSTVFHW